MAKSIRAKSYIENVCNQMMKGPKQGQLTATEEQKEEFRRYHEKQVEWIYRKLPRCSAAVAAVTLKCLIKYGHEPVEKWCKALKIGLFKGTNDPANLFSKYIEKLSSSDGTLKTYKKALYTCRAYMEGREIRQVRIGNADIFKWEDNYKIPREYVEEYERFTKEVILPDLDDAEVEV